MPVPFMPIIVPIQQIRDCTIVEGKKYCQDGNLSNSEIGAVIMILILLVIWNVFCAWLWIDKEKPIIASILFFLPFVCLSIVLMLI